MEFTDALAYEVCSSRWAWRIRWKWLQALAGAYFQRKTRRKWNRLIAVQQSVAKGNAERVP